MKIHGVGLKKAQALVKENITSIEMLRTRQDLLNDVQKKGLAYFEDINQRIPREEIEIYKGVFDAAFDEWEKVPTRPMKLLGHTGEMPKHPATLI